MTSLKKHGLPWGSWPQSESGAAQRDPEDRTTCVFINGDLARRDVSGFELPDRGFLPFDSRELLARLDDE